MPINDIERRLPTSFRLRLGHRVSTNNGKQRPAHLSGRIRVTSPYRPIAEKIQIAYDGDAVTAWESPEGPQWETILPAVPLVVGIIPGQSLAQWWERWASGTCERRCDGEHEWIHNVACQCPPVESRMQAADACRPVTRLSLLLPRLIEGPDALLAVGRLDSQGIIAATGLSASLDLVQAQLDAGHVIRATLTVRMRGNGAKQYVWPELVISGQTLELGTTVKELPS